MEIDVRVNDDQEWVAYFPDGGCQYIAGENQYSRTEALTIAWGLWLEKIQRAMESYRNRAIEYRQRFDNEERRQIYFR